MNIIATRIKLIDSEIQNLGKDCWSQCNKKQGPCSWCGAKGRCCTMKSGWTDKSNGCDGYFGGATGHQCAIKPSNNLFK